jgi:rhodanese-related sulfurtransferase
MAAPCPLQTLRALQRAAFPPTIIDVRRRAAFERDPVRIPMALRLDPEAIDAWMPTLERWRPVVVYCVHGHEVGRDAAERLAHAGFAASYLEGGIEGWRAAGGAVESWKPPTRWVTRERPKVDRIACPWLIRRFIDASAQIFYAPRVDVLAFADWHGATPFDIPDVDYTHEGERCSFDAFIKHHRLTDPALARLAGIVRAADTDSLPNAPQAAGLLAISLGLGAGIGDDRELLHHGLIVYDALYAWCREASDERHGWDAAALRARASP